MGGAWTRRRMIAWGLRGAAGLALLRGWSNTRADAIELSRVEVRIPGLPAALRGLRIAQLTDLHASAIVDNAAFRRAAALVMGERPDLIVMTGDFITGETRFLSGSIGEFDRRHLAESVASLAGLQAPLGIFGVLGNHDFWSGPAAVEAIMTAYREAFGLVWLRNRHLRVRRGDAAIDLIGIDDYWEDSCSLTAACAGLAGDGLRILLSHNPDINADLEAGGPRIDLVISGHTHGGQVVLPLVGQPVMPSKFGQKYRVGLVADGARQTWVGRGVGHLVAPTRFNCPPEVALLTLA